MPAAKGIVGPGITRNDIDLEVPDSIVLTPPNGVNDLHELGKKLVRAAHQNAADVLREMLARTPNGDKLFAEFAARLGVPVE